MLEFRVEVGGTLDGSVAAAPETSMRRLKKIESEFLLAREMLVERRVGVAALFRDVADRRGREAVLAEQLHRRAQDLALGRWVSVANVERQHSAVEVSIR